MKKLIPFALAAGAAAGYAIYKLKKAHDKKIIDLDEALLEEELLDDEDEIKIFNLSDKIEEAVEEEETAEEEATNEPAEDEFDEVFVNLKKKMF